MPVQIAIGAGIGGPTRIVSHPVCDETGLALALCIELQRAVTVSVKLPVA